MSDEQEIEIDQAQSVDCAGVQFLQFFLSYIDGQDAPSELKAVYSLILASVCAPPVGAEGWDYVHEARRIRDFIFATESAGKIRPLR